MHKIKLQISIKFLSNYRFANFIEGNSHLADNEVLQYETETTCMIEECEYTDDEDGLLLTDSD